MSDLHARRWLDNWRRAGPILHEERLARLAGMTDEDGRAAMLELFALWRPSAVDDLAAELVEHQRWFMKAAHIARAR